MTKVSEVSAPDRGTDGPSKTGVQVLHPAFVACSPLWRVGAEPDSGADPV